jgi:hypothetical protein
VNPVSGAAAGAYNLEMATFSLAAARTRVAARAGGRGWAWRRAGLGSSVAFCLAALVLLCSGGAPPRELRVEQMAASRAFPIVDWHLARLAERADRIGLGLLGAHPGPTDANRSAAAAYFAARSTDRPPLAPGAEVAIERAVSMVLRQEGLERSAPWTGDGEILFPPVSFAFTAPPEVLIVARRDRVSVVRSELLRPGIVDADAERLESDVDSLGYSSLVTPIGGLATFPTMVLDTNRPLDAVIAVTHEWIHGYLFFTPLGKLYWSSQDARTINETTAEMVSRELGPRAARELGFESPPSPATARPATPQPSTVQFRAMMRESRIRLDGLLRAGQIDEAEAYLRDRRLDFVAAGFQIRKLNQAYFAFYGSYGDAAAGVNPIPRQLGWLRAASGSSGEFLRRVGQLTSAEDLARAVGE